MSGARLVIGGAVAAGALAALMGKKGAGSVARAIESGASTVWNAAKDAAFRLVIPSEARPYADVILAVSKAKGVDPLITVFIGYHETRWGNAPGYTPKGSPGGTGDFTPRTWTKDASGKPYAVPPDGLGWGRGLMQIDYHSNRAWLAANNWRDPATNIGKGLDIFKEKVAYLSATPRTPYVAVTGTEATRRGVPPGDKYPDVRPLKGAALIHAALAAYNTGELNVLRSLAVGKSPDLTTATGSYGADLVAKVSAATAALGRS